MGASAGQALPADAGSRLADALASLGLSLDARQQAAVLAHLGLLARWNAVYNLTAVRDPAQMLVQHAFDCLAVVPALRDPAQVGRDRLADGSVVLDVGSGGGLPGVVLAIACPGVQVHFLQQVRGELGLANLSVHHARVESLAGRSVVPPVDLAISRAFASLADFVRLTEPLLAAQGAWAAMKGVLPEDELRALPPTVRLRAAITLGVPQLDARRHLLLLERAA